MNITRPLSRLHRLQILAMGPKRRAATSSACSAVDSSSGRSTISVSKKAKAEMTRKHDTSDSAESNRAAPALPKGRKDAQRDRSSPRESNLRTAAAEDSVVEESSANTTDGIPKRNKKGELIFPDFPREPCIQTDPLRCDPTRV